MSWPGGTRTVRRVSNGVLAPAGRTVHQAAAAEVVTAIAAATAAAAFPGISIAFSRAAALHDAPLFRDARAPGRFPHARPQPPRLC
jgi:hypothetical protein